MMGGVRPTGDEVAPAMSVVATLYKSEPYIIEFCHRAAEAARILVGDSYEIVLVNDGSPDQSIDVAVRLAAADHHIVVVDLSRNFGHHKAMMTGLQHARGDWVYLIDSDLEEEPEWIGPFAETLVAESADVVYGIQAKRKGGAFERWSGGLFYKVFNALTGLRLPENITVARLMTRRYLTALLRHDEREVFMAGLWHITGFRQVPMTVTKHQTSASTYSLRAKIAMLVNSVTSFSNAPLYAIFYIGVIISLIAGVFSILLLFQRLFLTTPPDGWTSVIASVWLIGGLIISFIGIIGIYLAKIFSETKRRPYTIVRQVYRNGQAHQHAVRELESEER